jgi:hypothetical protein
MLFFDIETDGLLDVLTKGHCLVIIDEQGNISAHTPDTFHKGAMKLLQALKDGEYICGHNIIDFDIPALEKLYPDFRVKREWRKYIIDTLVLARLLYGDIADTDYGRIRAGTMPAALMGRQSLKAWGYRLGVLKDTYGEKEDAWDAYSEEMLSYCVQDVTVTKRLYEYLMRSKPTFKSIELEHQVQWLMFKQQQNGFPFDMEKALKLQETLESRYAVLRTQLIAIVPRIPKDTFTPKVNNKARGYVKGVPIQRYKDFNPNSRQHIDWVLKNIYDYRPDNEDLYDEGDGSKEPRLKIDDETFTFIKQDTKAPQELREVAGVFEEFLMVSKRLGQLSTGNMAWLKFVKADGRIHGKVNPCGAVSGRATHSSPNMAQIPHVGSPYGQECRELFTCPKDWIFVGTDACGLELRCLAHYLAPYDKGAYAHTVVNGDIHTQNQQAAGLPTRNSAKTFIYAFLYGSGDKNIGKMLGGDANLGKQVKKKFLKATPAIAQLRQGVENALVEKYHGKIVEWKRHYLKGLDGRRLHVRSLHSALNLLLQSCGALICKKWIVFVEENMIKAGYKHGEDFQYMAWTHDEISVGCRTQEIADALVAIAQKSMRQVQEYYSIRCQLDVESKIGKNWYECH